MFNRSVQVRQGSNVHEGKVDHMVPFEIQKALRVDRGWVEMTRLAIWYRFDTLPIDRVYRQDLWV